MRIRDWRSDVCSSDLITSARALRRELAAVRRQGIAYDDCELDDDVRCIALPVRDFAGRCVGAIGISGPVWRMSRQAMAEKAQRLRTAAAALSHRPGCACRSEERRVGKESGR